MKKYEYIISYANYLNEEELNSFGSGGWLLCGIRQNGLNMEYIFSRLIEN